MAESVGRGQHQRREQVTSELDLLIGAAGRCHRALAQIVDILGDGDDLTSRGDVPRPRGAPSPAGRSSPWWCWPGTSVLGVLCPQGLGGIGVHQVGRRRAELLLGVQRLDSKAVVDGIRRGAGQIGTADGLVLMARLPQRHQFGSHRAPRNPPAAKNITAAQKNT